MSEIHTAADLFGCNVFSERVMRDRLPKNIYRSVMRTKQFGTALDDDVANVVANAMKDWAIEKGATHYTHWFQPMTGVTAEKHDAFLTPIGDEEVIMEFSGKELSKGEPDASSFPSGGLRSTFEARGYTAWDPTSNAFVKDNTLCIPTAFCSYTGEILDHKTPLLRSMEVVNEQVLRMLRLFGNTTATRVTTTVGPEQEYFLIDKKYYDQRLDLMLTGRTLFGAKAPKGQELEDHYFGNLKQRVSDFMKELDAELWKLGIYAKTEHNEVAPGQHELAPVFTTSNISADHNQLTMELMKKIAQKHGLYCLLHEKPFEGVNGSGKHNNWSISTNDGQNLLDPGDTPMKNLQFITFLCAFIKAVDEYATLLRISAASAGNDHRLGGNEAPPAIVSIFIGDELQGVLDALENGTSYKRDSADATFEIGVDALPSFPKDSTDRNRTSPLAFTGNKFEFRMLGSADSISCTNVMMNTSFAQAVSDFCDELEGKENFREQLKALLKKTIKEHKRIIFNGNGYSDEWIAEAARRGLPNYITTADCLPHYTDEKNVKMLEKFKVYTRTEIASRQEILLENYNKVINIEVNTMLNMAKREILPACLKYSKFLADAFISKTNAGLSGDLEFKLAEKVSKLCSLLSESIDVLDNDRIEAYKHQDTSEKLARYNTDVIIPDMNTLRGFADELEMAVDKEYWPLPTYTDLLFTV